MLGLMLSTKHTNIVADRIVPEDYLCKSHFMVKLDLSF